MALSWTGHCDKFLGVTRLQWVDVYMLHCIDQTQIYNCRFCHLLVSYHLWMAQVIGIFPCGRQEIYLSHIINTMVYTWVARASAATVLTWFLSEDSSLSTLRVEEFWGANLQVIRLLPSWAVGAGHLALLIWLTSCNSHRHHTLHVQDWGEGRWDDVWGLWICHTEGQQCLQCSQ